MWKTVLKRVASLETKNEENGIEKFLLQNPVSFF